MKATVSFTLGRTNYTLHLDGNDEREILHQAAVLGNPPQKCDECGVVGKCKLDSNKDKEGNIYVNVLCVCGAKAKLGLYKSGGFFWHNFEKYIPKNQDTPSIRLHGNPLPQDNTDDKNVEPEDDLPF